MIVPARRRARRAFPALAYASSGAALNMITSRYAGTYPKIRIRGPGRHGSDGTPDVRRREADQIRRRYGLPLPVEVRYDDYTVDIAENRLLPAASAGTRI